MVWLIVFGCDRYKIVVWLIVIGYERYKLVVWLIVIGCVVVPPKHNISDKAHYKYIFH